MDNPTNVISNETSEAKTLAFSEVIGRGGTCNFYKATHKSRLVGLKVATSKESHEMMKAEERIHKILSDGHPNIVQLIERVQLDGNIEFTSGLMMEMMDGPLTDVICGFERQERQGLPIKQCLYDYRHILHWMFQLSSALVYIHEKGFIHRDIKPDNILMHDENLTVKIGDFGITRSEGEVTHNFARTKRWAAPFCSTTPKLHKQDDVYSMAYILWQLVSRKRPFDQVNENSIEELIESGRRPAFQTFCLQFATILQNCWRPSREKRWTARDLHERIAFFNSKLKPAARPEPPVILKHTMLILPAGTTKIDGPSWMPTDITPFDPTFSEDSVPEEIFPVDIQHYPTDHDYEFVNDDDDDLISVEEKEGINPIENLFNENVLLAQSFPLFGYLLGAADGAKCDDQVAVIDQFCTQLQQATIDSDLLTFDEGLFTFQEENILQENFLKDAPSLLRNSFHQLMRQIITPVGELSPVELSFQVNQEIVKPIRACVSYLVKFLQKGTNFLAFEEEMGKKTIDNILENLTTILKEKGRFLYDWCEQRVSEWDHELYVNLFTIHKKSFQLTNLMKLFLIGAKCEGDFDEIRDYIDDFKIMKGMIEEIDEKFRSDFAYLDFLHHQVPEFDRNVAEIDLEELCYKLGSKKWSDTDEWINHYWLLSFSVDNNHFDVDPKYTHVCELHRETGRIYVLHRRSFHLAQDPPHLKATWNNWHGDEMKTVDFAVRDECNGIDVVNITLKQLIDQCHIKARLGAKECKTVITTGQMDFCSFGEHPNAAGRVIRMFNRISIFIGF